jgi:hypothetical protein
VPDLVVRVIARFDPGLRSVLHDRGRKIQYDPPKAEIELGSETPPIEQTIV